MAITETVKRIVIVFVMTLLVTACEERQESASQTAARERANPEGRIVTANQSADNLTVIDVATNQPYATIVTGKQPHHVLATRDGSELWVTLYGENRLQVFSAETLEEVASVDVGGSNDDLAFHPSGERLYVSMGSADVIAVVDVKARKLLEKVRVGKAPHGVRVTNDGKYLLVTNTRDNSVSIVNVESDMPKVEASVKAGVNPFEVIITEDNKTAYVSNFLGDSISIIDLVERKTVGYIRAGKKPAMLAFVPGSEQIWVAATGSAEVWLIDGETRKLVTRIPVGKGAHGTIITPNGKLYVTNSDDSTVSVIDTAQQSLVMTVPVGNYPNGLTYVPAK